MLPSAISFNRKRLVEPSSATWYLLSIHEWLIYNALCASPIQTSALLNKGPDKHMLVFYFSLKFPCALLNLKPVCIDLWFTWLCGNTLVLQLSINWKSISKAALWSAGRTPASSETEGTVLASTYETSWKTSWKSSLSPAVSEAMFQPPHYQLYLWSQHAAEVWCLSELL